ncbi:major capsid protein [Amycolatopsis sp. Poz14]|uniref:major capsid protein n=1 Tax=Amycolatopsis sp. Poz14 TaxID=1447705 RepID=UPI001EE7FFD6|nr:major capsid protein [Amycolatopsis sp. Poz14]MCG3756691.1 major capsid protein [Amycolatopsis sp. Poz14]
MKISTIKQGTEILAQLTRQGREYGTKPFTEENVLTMEKLAAEKRDVESQLAALRASSGPARTVTEFQGRPVNQAALVDELAKVLTDPNGGLQHGRNALVHVTTEYPTGRQLDNGPGVMAKIRAAMTPEAITAAGGLCAPLDVVYDVPVIGSEDRPIRDALNQFQATHGGIRYRRAIDASSLTAGVWTTADDALVGTEQEVTKAVQSFACPEVEAAEVAAVYSLLELSNFTARFDTEYATAALRASVIAHAKVSENRLLSQILAGSTPVTLAKRLGAARDVLAGLDQAVSYFRSRRRSRVTPQLTWIVPVWVRDMLRADIVRQQASADTETALAESDSAIARWFAARNVTPVWHLDGLPAQAASDPLPAIPAQTFPAATPGAALPTWPTTVDTALFPSGEWLFLDGGRLDLGVVRDSTLNGKNRYQTFTETFEGTAFVGVESLRLIMTVAATGEAQAPITPAA